MQDGAHPGGPVVGVDEAGRGPVLGPLVVAGVRVRDERGLREAGVADSKSLSARRREELATVVRELAEEVVVRVAPVAEVDASVAEGNLNGLEARLFGEVAAALGPPPARLIVDACDVDAARFGRRVMGELGASWRDVAVVSEHGADAAHPAVSAASILAKVTRDRRVAELGERLGAAVGSGYPSDPATRRFLAEWVEAHGELPPGTRRTWTTAKRLVPRDRSLLEYSGGP